MCSGLMNLFLGYYNFTIIEIEYHACTESEYHVCTDQGSWIKTSWYRHVEYYSMSNSPISVKGRVCCPMCEFHEMSFLLSSVNVIFMEVVHVVGS